MGAASVVNAIEFVCPLCKGELQACAESYYCARDERSYRITHGIADFRVFSDPYISIADEDCKVERLLNAYARCTFDELVAFYYRITDDVSPELARKYQRYTASSVTRGESSLAEIRQARAQVGGALLDVGCGTAGLLAAAAGDEYEQFIGVDIALRWLVIAQKRWEELGRKATLVCACAEYLPFRDHRFQLVVASDIIEHTRDPVELMREARRVLDHDGALFLSTPNRWTLAPDPHMKLFGLGFLPRAWRDAYVRAVRHVPYRIRTLNYFEIQRLFLQSGFERWNIYLPAFEPAHAARLTRWERAIVPLYHALKDLPVLKWYVYLYGPLFHMLAFKNNQHG